MAKFRKLPIEVEAIQWDGTAETKSLIEETFKTDLEIKENWLNKTNDLLIKTLEGTMTAIVGDWIIQGVNKEIYPCKNDIFEKSYEKCIEL
jgi:hypothetical protein